MSLSKIASVLEPKIILLSSIWHIENIRGRVLGLTKPGVDSLSSIDTELSKITYKIDNLPPKEWRRRVEILETKEENLDETMNIINTKNIEDHSKILVLLEKITTTLDLIQEK